MKQKFKIAILGTGLMGSWLAEEFSRTYQVAAYDLVGEKVPRLPDLKILADLSELKSFAPELLINAVSLQHTISAFRSALPYLEPDCILADVASIKNQLPIFYQLTGMRFVSVHPMFGPTFANLAALKEENAVIITESDPAGAQFFRRFFKILKLNIFDYSFAQHDEMMAYSLTLPFASSMVFAACVNPKAVPGTTFARHKKIAQGLLREDNHLLSEILFNRYSLAELEKVIARLELLRKLIKKGDYGQVEKFLNNLRKNLE